MQAYVIRRLIQIIPVLLFVTIMSYSLVLLTGDPIQARLGPGEAYDAEQIEYLSQKWGLDKPIPVQYAIWLSNAVQGDFGRSTITNRLVIDEISARLLVTLQLGIAAWLFSVVVAIPAGVISAVRRGSKLDLLATIITIGGVATPGFWLGILLILLFGVTLHWLPTYGFVSLFDDPIQGLRHLILPAISLGITTAAINMRQMRSSMLEVLAQDYIRTARAKGLRERTVIGVHALKNSFLPVLTLMGLQIGRLFGGAVVIETLFAIPGMGRLMVTSIFNRDFPIVQACVLIIALSVVLANLATDLLYAYLDPRIRYS